MSDDTLLGKQIESFLIESVLGHADSSTVYYARQLDSEQVVVIKVLPHGLLRDEALAERFRQETRAIARLAHPGIARVFGAGQVEGRPYIVREHMPGGSLADRLEGQGSLPLEEMVEIVAQAATALDYAHGRGLLHRDLKPGNILFDEVGNACLADFSLGSVREALAALSGLPLGGSPAYLAPEVARGERDLTPAADVYALGVTLFEALTGQLPYESERPVRQIMMHLDTPVPSPGALNPAIAPPVEAVIRKALAKDPAERYATAGNLARALAAAAGIELGPEPTIDLHLAPGKDGGSTPQHAQAEGDEDEGWREASYPSRPLSRQQQRRLAQQAARRRRAERRAARRAAGGRRWISVALALLMLVIAWFAVGLLVGNEARRQVDAAEVASIQAMQTPVAATAFAEGTATSGAYLSALGTATWEALEAAQTATGQAQAALITPSPTATLSPTPTPFAGSRGLVAFVSERDGDPDIFVIDLNSGQETRITNNTVVDGAPAWSPDGRMLAYHSNTAGTAWHIYVVDIACVNRPDGCVGSERQLTSSLRRDAYPVWSADGERIAFLSNEGQRWWFRSVTLGGEEIDLVQMPGSMRLLDWSAGGMLTFYGDSLAGTFEVMTLPSGGISTDRVAITAARSAIEFVSFSPDRRQVVYPALTEGRRQLFLADATCELIDACVTARLTNDTANYLTPRFSPDGRLILAATDGEGSLDLVVLDRQGQLVRRLTEQLFDDYDGVWQPGG